MDRSKTMRIEEGETDYELQLTPRIKLNLEITGYPETGISSDSIENALLTISNANGFFSGVNANLSLNDINLQLIPRKARCTENPPPLLFKGKGTMVYRNLSFVHHLNKVKQLYLPEDQLHIRLRKLRDFIKDILSGATQSMDQDGPWGGYGYDYIWAVTPAGEDADEMMNTLPADLSQPPAILVKGLPCKWFCDPSNPSLPSKKRVLHLFKELGDNGELDTSVNNSRSGYFEITLQYTTLEECHNALKQLCSFSLQKVEGDSDSSLSMPEYAEYEVSWKDFTWNDTFDSLAETERLLKTGQPSDCSGSTSKSDVASQIEALQNQLDQLQKDLRNLKASHDGEKSKGQ